MNYDTNRFSDAKMQHFLASTSLRLFKEGKGLIDTEAEFQFWI
jgi:hypothetical protein